MDTFCVLPWYSLELPNNTPCCLLPQNANIDQVKNDLSNGIKSSACSKCWTVESQGQKSRRQFENEFLDYKLDQDLNNLQKDCIESRHTTLLYQITTSNLCNQACVSCNSSLSSKWAEIEGKMGIVPSLKKSIDLENSNINYSTARRISLLGGEPFFDPKTFEILEKLVEHNNTDCFISLVTNGSIVLKQSQLDLLLKFTDLNICISIDGIGPVFEYMRWPAKWNDVCNNIEKLQQITDNISISYTISSLNILYYQQTVDWFNTQKLRYNHNLVSFPTWLSLEVMPVKIKKLLSNNSFAKLWVPENGNEIDLKDYYIKIQKQDQAKKINVKNYLPELAIIFDTLIDEL
jgi:sulfatase maturation enzyme AslB (radical SAM superfamily)